MIKIHFSSRGVWVCAWAAAHRCMNLSSNSSNWELTIWSNVSTRRRASLVLRTDFMFGHITLPLSCGAGSRRVSFISYGRKGGRGSTLTLTCTLSGPLFPSLHSRVRCTELRTWEQNVSLRCRQPLAVLASSTFMESKKESWKRPGRPSLTQRLGAAREQQRPHNSACSRGWPQCAVETEKSSALYKSPRALESHLGLHLIIISLNARQTIPDLNCKKNFCSSFGKATPIATRAWGLKKYVK